MKQGHWLALGALGVLVFVAVNRPPLEVVIPGSKVKQPQPLEPNFSSRTVYPFADMNAFELIVPFLGHWTTGNYRRGYGWHTGADWIGRDASRGRGSRVLSISDGVVVNSTAAVSARGYGNMVVIHHPALGVWTRSAHLERRYVATGQAVRAGQVIGSLGASGTDNVHLHFDVIREALPVSRFAPWRFFPKEDRAAVERYFVNPVAFLHARGAGET